MAWRLVCTISLRADRGAEAIAKLDHLAKLISGVDMQQRERDLAGIESLLRQPHHHRRVLADGIQHHRLLKLRRHLANDVNALGFERPQMSKKQVGAHEAFRRCWLVNRLILLHELQIKSSPLPEGIDVLSLIIDKRGGEKGLSVAHALVRAASRLFSTRLRPRAPGVGRSADAARTSACARVRAATFANVRR